MESGLRLVLINHGPIRSRNSDLQVSQPGVEKRMNDNKLASRDAGGKKQRLSPVTFGNTFYSLHRIIVCSSFHSFPLFCISHVIESWDRFRDGDVVDVRGCPLSRMIVKKESHIIT